MERGFFIKYIHNNLIIYIIKKIYFLIQYNIIKLKILNKKKIHQKKNIIKLTSGCCNHWVIIMLFLVVFIKFKSKKSIIDFLA